MVQCSSGIEPFPEKPPNTAFSGHVDRATFFAIFSVLNFSISAVGPSPPVQGGGTEVETFGSHVLALVVALLRKESGFGYFSVDWRSWGVSAGE